MAKRHCAISPGSWKSSCGAALLALCWASAADAREPSRTLPAPGPALDISATRLPDALAELSREAGVSIGTSGRLPAVRTPPLHGRMNVAQALARLLAGTGLAARQVSPTAWRIEPARAAPAPAPASPPPAAALPAPETVATDPIVVTAPKRRAALLDLPMAVAVVSLSRARGADPASGTALIAAQSEGLAMTALGPGRNRLFLRGVADSPFNGESQSTVAVVLDDARVTYAAPDPDIRLVDVERVEVLKGPQGSLYGSGALGGIYHIVTRHADLEGASLAMSGGAESIAHGAAGVSGSAVANLPLLPGRAALRLVGYAAREAGWVDTGPRADSNGNRLLGARANLGVAAGGDWRADITGFMQLLESRDTGYVYAPGARARPAQLPEPHDNDLRHLSVRLAREGGPMEVMLSSGITWHEVGDEYDATVGAESFGLARPSVLEDKRQYRVWDSEARISGKAGGLRWLAGLSHVAARQSNLWRLQSFSAPPLTIDDDRRSTRDTALFGDMTVPLTGTVKLDAGARLFVSSVVERRPLGAALVARHRHRSGFTPSAALSWKPAPRDLLYLRYSSAIRDGGSDIAADGTLETLKGDELATIEAAWRRETAGGRFEIGLYASRWKNLQSDMLLPNGLIESENAGNARILGVEASLDQRLAPGWRIEAGASLTSAVLVRGQLGMKLDDRRLPVVPRHVARLALDHAFALGPADLLVRATLRHVGAQRLSFDPALDRPMGSYFESRIEFQAALAGFRMVFAADNLLGGTRDAFAFGNSLRFASQRQYTPQRPAGLSISLGKEF